jgi:hypothetical protein
LVQENLNSWITPEFKNHLAAFKLIKFFTVNKFKSTAKNTKVDTIETIDPNEAIAFQK